jgi:malate synthase
MNPEIPPNVEMGPSLWEKADTRSRVSPRIRSAAASLPEPAGVLSTEAVRFLCDLSRRFGPRRDRLLAERRGFYQGLAEGGRPALLDETAAIRRMAWEVAPPPPDLVDRRVEITGPPTRRTILHALNSGASVFMADFEDAHSPTWSATLTGQELLSQAIAGTLEDTSRREEPLRLGPHPAVLMVRPRGWHLDEPNFAVDGRPIAASLFDFGLYFFRNARELCRRGTGPYFYLPKIEHYREARLWDEIFLYGERWFGLPAGTIRATVLIETLPAVFEMEEILYELRLHSAGLNLGRWDYIFSMIKSFRTADWLKVPDRGALGMDTRFLHAAARLLVATCHKRGAAAIGGMAAQVPVKNDARANRRAIAQVLADKKRELHLGYDGTWVAHPALVPIAREVFDAKPPGLLGPVRADGFGEVAVSDLLALPEGPVTDEGLRTNIRAPLRYLESWLRGIGAVAIDGRMEDAATVEISRAQLWHWVRSSAALDSGLAVTAPRVRELLREEADQLRSEIGDDERRAESLEAAARLVERLALGPEFPEFFPLVVAPFPAEPERSMPLAVPSR